MSYEIKFGTDGWRAVISDGFTFSNVKRVTQAACDVVRKVSKSRLILIGYDRRFFSPQFADTAARVATANGFPNLFGQHPCPGHAQAGLERIHRDAIEQRAAIVGHERIDTELGWAESIAQAR